LPALPSESVLLVSGLCNCFLTGKLRDSEISQEVILFGSGTTLKFGGSWHAGEDVSKICEFIICQICITRKGICFDVELALEPLRIEH